MFFLSVQITPFISGSQINADIGSRLAVLYH